MILLKFRRTKRDYLALPWVLYIDEQWTRWWLMVIKQKSVKFTDGSRKLKKRINHKSTTLKYNNVFRLTSLSFLNRNKFNPKRQAILLIKCVKKYVKKWFYYSYHYNYKNENYIILEIHILCTCSICVCALVWTQQFKLSQSEFIYDFKVKYGINTKVTRCYFTYLRSSFQNCIPYVTAIGTLILLKSINNGIHDALQHGLRNRLNFWNPALPGLT